MTTRGEDDEMTATDTMSTAVSERLQLSGERDQLKSMLLEDLRSHGWTESMFKAAAKAVAVHQVENETVATGPGKSSQALSACQLAELIAKPGHGKSSLFLFIFKLFLCFNLSLQTFFCFQAIIFLFF